MSSSSDSWLEDRRGCHVEHLVAPHGAQKIMEHFIPPISGPQWCRMQSRWHCSAGKKMSALLRTHVTFTHTIFHTQLCHTHIHIHIHIHIYIYTYIHTYIHTYVRTYVHTYIRTYVHTYIRTYVHTYIRTYVHTYIRTYVHTYIRTYVHTYIHMYVRTYVRMYIHTYIRTYLHTYIRTYVHTYIRTYVHAYYLFTYLLALSHAVFHIPLCHTQLFYLLDLSPPPLSFLPSPSPLKPLKLSIGRSWLVGLSGPLMFKCRQISTRIGRGSLKLWEFLVVFYIYIYIYIIRARSNEGGISRFNQGYGGMRKKHFLEPFFFAKPGLSDGLSRGHGDIERRVATSHLWVSQGQCPPQKKSDRAFFFRNRKPGQTPAPGSQPRERIRRQNSPEARGLWLSG